MSETERLTKPEVFKVVEYIGSQRGAGYLGNFSYKSHSEFYPQYCDLNIDTDKYEGTTRDRFITILSNSDGYTQAKILEGVLTKFPISYFSEGERPYKEKEYEHLSDILSRLHELNPTRKVGISSAVKNLIFAANGPKPEIILIDATTNDLRIVKNGEYCLIYDREISATHGLLWADLVSWWKSSANFYDDDLLQISRNLYLRLKASLASEAELILFRTYFEIFNERLKNALPALIPQVYLHYDPYTSSTLGGIQRLPRQRMDFLLLLPNRVNIVIEIDGKQHYSENNQASPCRYAEMVAEDRRLKLSGYEIFRFGGHEFIDAGVARNKIENFFENLFKRYVISG
jgi:hypothetical protein